jgi:cytoskeletal protein RodZ
MNPMKKVMIFSAFIMAPVVIALAIWLVQAVLMAEQTAKFMSAFDKIHETKPPLSIAQVEQLMGRPASIEQSESADQTVTGAVYHYPYPAHGQDFKVIFVHGVVFGTQFVPLAKS